MEGEIIWSNLDLKALTENSASLKVITSGVFEK